MKTFTQRTAVTGAIFAAFGMLLLSIADALGIYQGAVEMMTEWHMFYDSATVIGTLTGMIEAAVVTYISVLIIMWIYGLLDKKSK